MDFEVQSNDGYSILTMNAESLDAQTTPKLRSELVILSGKGVNKMIIDLTKCKSCDAVGLSAILIAHRLCKDGRLFLVGVCEEVERMLSIQRFDPPIVILDNINEAIDRMNN
ncbi:MAG: STAS domain-containing protein [Marinilabiliaceae bacterium]|jgi:anti-anti-sigma factor|nr:STAS domain-containing protein [Bacteroidales bacterium]MCR5696119.1 STAS domain-containing protein [Marinilabiliaceae bacterium]